MDWHYIMAIVAGILAAAAALPYLLDMVRGTTRPNIVTWGLWFLIQGIVVAGQISAGASFSIVLPVVEIVMCGLIVALGLFGYGYKKYGPLDFFCLAFALGAIVLWQVTSDPLLAIWMAVVADILAAIPTLVKAYKDPASETPLAYFIVVLSAIFAALSTTIYNAPNLLWPAYIFVINAATVSLIFLGRRAKKAHK